MGAGFKGLTGVCFTAVAVQRFCLTPRDHSTAHHDLQESAMAVSHLL